MLEVVLTYSTDEGTEEIFLDSDKTSFGRGGEAEYRFEDDGLSRLHASIYIEDDHIWVVDENSTNGTFVNGEKVTASGIPLEDGDTVKIGHYTKLRVSIQEPGYEPTAAAPDTTGESEYAAASSSSTTTTESESPSPLIPLMITGFAFLVICGAAVFIGISVMGNNSPQYVENRDGFDDGFDDDGFDDEDTADSDGSSEDNSPVSPQTNNPTTTSPVNSSPPVANSDGENLTDSPTANKQTGSSNLPSGKTYQAMSDAEKNQYVKAKAEKVARIIGNRSGESIPPAAIVKIRRFLDSYVSRIRRAKKNDCSGKGWLSSDMVSILERARKNAPFIIRAFNKRGIDPQVGLYLAMIESEHCPCLQSYTGPLGMFQFTRATGKRHGLDTRRGASPSNPDERCQPEPAARAAASYMKSLTGRIGTGPLSIPLAIASYNSGEGGLGKNLRIALEANESQERSFWTLVANSEKLAEQFQRENIKYVPKFFAAAIIGENPRDFGISGMRALSTYTK